MYPASNRSVSRTIVDNTTEDSAFVQLLDIVVMMKVFRIAHKAVAAIGK